MKKELIFGSALFTMLVNFSLARADLTQMSQEERGAAVAEVQNLINNGVLVANPETKELSVSTDIVGIANGVTSNEMTAFDQHEASTTNSKNPRISSGNW